MKENVNERMYTASVALRFAEKTDGVNKRLVRTLLILAAILAVVVASFCVRDSIVSNSYFEHEGMSNTSMT